MATKSLTKFISALKTTSAVTSSNALESIIGRTPGGQVDVYFTAGSSSSATAYVEYSFDLSAIPDNAKIDTVSCSAGGYSPSTSYYSTYTAQLYSGSVAKGNTGNVRNTAFNTVATFDGGAWTRAELNDCRLRYTARKSKSGSSHKCYMSGAQLTVTYTYQSDKFMLKLGGSWTDVARVFKKVNGIWVEQTDLANVVDQTKRLVNGGEYVVELPEGYTRLEYIESTGSQYIDTGFKPKYNTRVVMDISGLGTSQQWLFGARDYGASTAENQFCLYRSSATAVRSDYFGTNASLTISDTTERTTADKNANIVSLFGETITNTVVSSGECSYPLYLFTINNVGIAHSNKASIRLYFCLIYDNGTLIRKLLPCTNASGVPGLYDVVNGVFYQSASGTAFIAPSSGGSSANLITFTIDGTSYQAEDGMTWTEWCGSSYNKKSFYVSGGFVWLDGVDSVAWDDEYVGVNDVIVEGRAYYLV